MSTLLELTGLDRSDCERRMRYLGFEDEDRRRLAEIAPFVDSIADEMLDAFYERLLSTPETAAFLADPEMVVRLKQAQHRHLVELCSGPYDADYFESRLRVGFVHARIRLAPHLYLAAYLFQFEYLFGRLRERFGEESPKTTDCLGSLSKIIMLDIALATEAYIHGGYVERSAADAQAAQAALAQEALELKVREEEKREELLRMVAHDIRSPVAAIMATARAALRRFPDTAEPPGRQFELVEETGQSVLHIIDNMVSHARAPAGEIPIAPEPFDVAEVVSACVSQLMPFAQQTAHSLTVVALDPTPSTRLDKVLVRRVVSNLLVNACRHTPAGSAIEVECGPDGDHCRIVVSDDGPGLPTPVLEAFTRSSLRPRDDAGACVDSGLGLPFCQMACERMGGRIGLEPPRRRGTRFVVFLPS